MQCVILLHTEIICFGEHVLLVIVEIKSDKLHHGQLRSNHTASKCHLRHGHEVRQTCFDALPIFEIECSRILFYFILFILIFFFFLFFFFFLLLLLFFFFHHHSSLGSRCVPWLGKGLSMLSPNYPVLYFPLLYRVAPAFV